jgi:ribA/ribD-fused uncharacterized protein
MMVNGKERDYIVHDDQNIKGFFGKYRFLSNFHVIPVIYEGVEYPATENAYMAAKTLDLELRKQFENLTPSEAKKLGRSISLRPDWEEVKYDIMKEVCRYKFTKHQDMRDCLLETGDKYLEETNSWGDKIWGVCDGAGLNLLGKILMEIRTGLKESNTK